MIAAIIQARLGSNRLPGKVLKQVNGVPLLEYQINRVKKSKHIDQIVVATSTLEQDNLIADFCNERKIHCFRGSEEDVLGRYYHCAKKYNAGIIIRLTADCPLIDPAVIDQMVTLFEAQKVDYVANTTPPETSMFPDGSDVEIFSMEGLTQVFNEASDPQDREHVTFYFWKYEHAFRTA